MLFSKISRPSRNLLVYIILGKSFIRAKQVEWLSERHAIWIHITRVRQDECNMDPNSMPFTKPLNLFCSNITSAQYNIWFIKRKGIWATSQQLLPPDRNNNKKVPSYFAPPTPHHSCPCHVTIVIWIRPNHRGQISTLIQIMKMTKCFILEHFIDML